jgi:drug/metabolite transporter (DMT)-like permease
LDFKSYALLLGAGLFGLLAQISKSTALSLESAGRCSIVNYLQVVLAYAFDVLVMDQKVHWPEIVGALLIVSFSFIGNLWVWRKSRRYESIISDVNSTEEVNLYEG